MYQHQKSPLGISEVKLQLQILNHILVVLLDWH